MAEFSKRLIASPRIEVVFVDEVPWSKGREIYEKYSDKKWSLTDCISMAVMKEKGLVKALTHDEHIRQAGFGILLQLFAVIKGKDNCRGMNIEPDKFAKIRGEAPKGKVAKRRKTRASVAIPKIMYQINYAFGRSSICPMRQKCSAASNMRRWKPRFAISLN